MDENEDEEYEEDYYDDQDYDAEDTSEMIGLERTNKLLLDIAECVKLTCTEYSTDAIKDMGLRRTSTALDLNRSYEQLAGALQWSPLFQYRYEVTAVSDDIWKTKLCMHRWEFSYFPLCCGYAIAGDAYTHIGYRRSGIGKLCREFRIEMARSAGFGRLIATDVSGRQKKSFINEGWELIDTFKNPRTDNMVCMWSYDLIT